MRKSPNSEPAPVRAGHVGARGVIEGKIIGFHPTSEATEGRTTVSIYDADVSEEMLATIRLWYDEGKSARGEYNCAVFWTRFGVELPVKTGSLKEPTDKMKAGVFQIPPVRGDIDMMALRTPLIFLICVVTALTAVVKKPTPANSNSANATVVSSCDVINSSGEFELAEGFIGPPEDSTEPCITIATSAVILDCQAVEINLSGTAVGIRVDASLADVTVKNCVVSGGEVGIVVDAAEEILVTGNTISDGTRGIVLEDTSRSEVRDNHLTDQDSDGIVINGGSGNTIANNTVFRTGGTGISLDNSNSNVLQDNESYGNDVDGIVLGHSRSNTVVDNYLSTNGLRGLHLFNESTHNTIRSNRSYCNTLLGIAIYTLSANNTVEENKMYGNVYGIGLLHEASGNTIVNNESFDNEGCGFYLESAADNTFDGNLAWNNGRCGLAVLPPAPEEGPDPRDNVFSNNRLLNNGSYGVVIASELVATNSLSDNMFAGNGLEDFFTPHGSVLSDFGQYVGADPASCSNP